MYLELNPDEYRASNMGAFALHSLGRLDEAKRWMDTSMQNAPRNSILNYNAASFYAMTGDIDKSLEYLEQAAETGCLNLEWLAQDPDLNQIRDDPRFNMIIRQVKGGCSSRCSNPACL